MCLVVDVGQACADYQDHALRNLSTRRSQLDEVRSFDVYLTITGTFITFGLKRCSSVVICRVRFSAFSGPKVKS